MGIDDVRRVAREIGSPDKYEPHIRQMMDSMPRKPDGSIDWTQIKKKPE